MNRCPSCGAVLGLCPCRHVVLGEGEPLRFAINVALYLHEDVLLVDARGALLAYPIGGGVFQSTEAGLRRQQDDLSAGRWPPQHPPVEVTL